MVLRPSGAGSSFALDSWHANSGFGRMPDPACAPEQNRGNSMSDLDRNYEAARAGYHADQVAIDAGLRAYMIRVYNYMAAGVALTGVVAWLTFSAAVVQTSAGLQLTAFGQAVFQSPLMWVLVLAPLGLVFAISFGINRMQPATALMLFFVYA